MFGKTFYRIKSLLMFPLKYSFECIPLSPNDDRSICAMTWKIVRFSGNRSSRRVPFYIFGPEDDTVLSPGYRLLCAVFIFRSVSSQHSHHPKGTGTGLSPSFHAGDGAKDYKLYCILFSVFYSSVLAFCFSHFYMTAKSGYLRHFEPKVARCKF